MSVFENDFGMVGLGTMGKSLLLNIADHGHKVSGLDTDPAKVQALNSIGEHLHAFTDVAEFVKSIRKPRAIMMLVPAGSPVDSVIANLKAHLEPGDFIIDGGNSYYKDTERRAKQLSETGLGFMGMGVSGGESGARHGPSMMPGGTPENYERVRPILESVAAHYEGEPCVALVGARSAGHYVKTVHNGIEYGIMQLIAEAYDLLKRGLGMPNEEIADVFGAWNDGELKGFLVEITGTVLKHRDEKTGGNLVDLISDKAKQKGTGKWTSQDAMDLGIPIPTIDAAVAARELSGLKPQREEVAKLLPRHTQGSTPDARTVLTNLYDALYAGILLTYVQGFSQLHAASEEYQFGTDLATVAKIWRAGCIVRSGFLEPIREAFERNPALPNLLLDPLVASQLMKCEPGLRNAAQEYLLAALPAPALFASVSYLDGVRSPRLPANLIQAQRDLFGAHTYERLDEEGTFHTEW